MTHATRLLPACCIVLLGACGASIALAFPAHVTHVTDGDTLWVRPLAGGAPRAVRIEGIDAPEICQPGGPQAREALATLIEHTQVEVIPGRSDDFGRTLAHLEVAGRDIGSDLVRQGHAWSYRYRHQTGPYIREEKKARHAQLGLWHAPHPMEPRVFRRWHGPCERGEQPE